MLESLLPRFDFDEIATYIFLAFCLFGLIQLIMLLFVYSRVAFHRHRKQQLAQELPGISVVIAARNESENLFQFLPFILEQDYPNFEVIVVNHQSIDDSKYILQAYELQYKHLRHIDVEKNNHMKFGKKLPLTIGIKGAKYEHMVFTDADCKPSSNQWLRSMAGRFNPKKQIVLGYGPMFRRKGFLNRLIRFDTAWIAMNYFSFAKTRVPYMGIGRNMAYTKDVFDKADGFKSHYALSSGDDDLFIQDAARKRNYEINLDPNSFCYSKAAKSTGRWFQQKSRHYTTTSHYRVFKKLMLGIYPLSLLFLLGTFVTLLFDESFIWLTLAVFIFLLIIKWIIIGKALIRLKESKFVAWLPFWDIFYAIWTPVMFYTVSKTDTNKW